MESGKEEQNNSIDDAGFTARMNAVYGSLLSFAKILTKNSIELEAEDLVQDTMVRAWTNKHLYTRDEAFAAWCKKIMKNLFITQSTTNDRMKMKRDDEEYTVFDYLPKLVSHNEGFNDICLADIDESISEVLEERDQYIVREFLKGVSQEEIANALGTNRNNIKQRYFISIRKVREDLREKFDIEESEYKQSEEMIKRSSAYHKRSAQIEYIYRKKFDKE